ncbi:MAG: Hsp70 family protein [Acidobacteria bacterium]|nr:Hsp70 family protein [Acidobacteriota bacterium]
MNAQYVIGVDLGTTNCGVAAARIPAGDETAQVELVPVAQLINPGEVSEEPLLPSFLFAPGTNDFPAGSTTLPWDSAPRFVTGTLARKRGSETAGRLIASAKSWLSYAGVDRTSALLPAGAAEGVARISPVEASRRYLEHLRDAWNHARPGVPFEQQRILVTVPASFDAVARDLTERAAADAGLHNVVLLEEPQAAFYAWLARHEDWRHRVSVGDTILVIDVGGGTTDFTLIAVTAENGELRLERVAVGDHILLGGDNMDLALARFVEEQLAAKTRLDTMQLFALWQQCRAAKEALLAGTKADHPITLLGKGSGLIAGTIKTKLARASVNQILLDGFFPEIPSTEVPQRQRRAALAEIGLPYATDAGITRHLAQFLRRQGDGLAMPTHVLFNGGVFQAALLRERLLAVLNAWAAEAGRPPVRPLDGEDLMHAVSRGAAYYGLARQGRGVRIRGGIAQTYYVGVESSMPAVPGLAAPMKALTVASFGMEEGTSSQVPGREFGLRVGEPAEFRFFSSASRKHDEPGFLLDEVGSELTELSPVEVELAGDAGGFVPVVLESAVTETGVLQLWCVARDGRRWKLEFNVRERVS